MRFVGRTKQPSPCRNFGHDRNGMENHRLLFHRNGFAPLRQLVRDLVAGLRINRAHLRRPAGLSYSVDVAQRWVVVVQHGIARSELSLWSFNRGSAIRARREIRADKRLVVR